MQGDQQRQQAKTLMHHYLTYGRPEIDGPDNRAEIDALVDCLVDAAVDATATRLAGRIDHKCTHCDGSGLVWLTKQHYSKDTCPHCQGTGYELTEDGLQVVRAVMRHLDSCP